METQLPSGLYKAIPYRGVYAIDAQSIGISVGVGLFAGKFMTTLIPLVGIAKHHGTGSLRVQFR